jgi:hypothetical protein
MLGVSDTVVARDTVPKRGTPGHEDVKLDVPA